MRHRNDGRGIFDNTDMVPCTIPLLGDGPVVSFCLIFRCSIMPKFSTGPQWTVPVSTWEPMPAWLAKLSCSWRKENRVSQYMGLLVWDDTEKKICGASEFISHLFFSRMDDREEKIDSRGITGSIGLNSQSNNRSKDILITGLSWLTLLKTDSHQAWRYIV